jgi:hypothetical protein
MTVKHHIKRRLAALIRPFFPDPSDFLCALTKTHSVISGSQALSFMIPPFQGRWKPKDMDIYTNSDNVIALISYIEQCGYTRAGTDGRGIQCMEDIEDDKLYVRLGGISHVIKMSKEEKQIDIIVSNRTSPIYPIFFFHTTLVQNFISGKGFFSAYPTLTDNSKAILNPISFSPHKYPTAKIGVCVQKYNERGFETGMKLADVDDGPEHKCHQSPICPHTTRTTADRGCLFLPFKSATIKSKTVHRIYGSWFGLTWHMGGASCDGTYDTMRPAVRCTGSFVNP